MSSSTKAIIILIVIILAEAAWIYFHDPMINPPKDNSKELRDSIALGQVKYDSLSKVITSKDHKYDSLEQAKPPVEYRTYERLVYIDKSDATELDKFIRSNWDTARQRKVLHY